MKDTPTLWAVTPSPSDAASALTEPSAYSGLYGFHKYWGKKPTEPLRFLIKELTHPGDLVVDPFVGSGAIGRETVQAGRRFIGGDLNPIAVKLTKFFLSPCEASAFSGAYQQLEQCIRPLIDDTYRCEDGAVASHFLWDDEKLSTAWVRNSKCKRIERAPTQFDMDTASQWKSYRPSILRPLRLFDNSRINAKSVFDWNTFFTGRALRNIELLLTYIRNCEESTKNALEMVLTSSMGQMSNMVFAITSRGKTNGAISNRTEVGSWVIGYWRPAVHFEINVWNCFGSKAAKLLASLRDTNNCSRTPTSSIGGVVSSGKKAAVERCDAKSLLYRLPDGSVQLLFTDPPHGDRIPYLELSEMWNGVLNELSSFEDEIVISNARQRGKTIETYLSALDTLFVLASRKLRLGGVLALLFNSRRSADWRAIRHLATGGILSFIGRFPLTHSATSVVQDNRVGSMKTDYILLFAKGACTQRTAMLAACGIPGWSVNLPTVEKA